MNRFRLSKNQLARISEILGNISVAWFSAGAIAPLFARPQNALDFILPFGLSLIMATAFAALSLYFMKGIKK